MSHRQHDIEDFKYEVKRLKQLVVSLEEQLNTKDKALNKLIDFIEHIHFTEEQLKEKEQLLNLTKPTVDGMYRMVLERNKK